MKKKAREGRDERIYCETCARVLSDNLEAVVGRQRENTILMGLFTPFSERERARKKLEHRNGEAEKEQAVVSRR